MKKFRVTIQQVIKIVVHEDKDATKTAEHIAKYIAPVSLREGYTIGNVKFFVQGLPAIIMSIDSLSSNAILKAEAPQTAPRQGEPREQKVEPKKEEEDAYELF